MYAWVMSAVAAARLTPGLRSTIIDAHVQWYVLHHASPGIKKLLLISWPYAVIGMKAAGGSLSHSPANPAGVTPMIVYMVAPIWMGLPSTSRAPPNLVCHIGYVSTATGVPLGALSSASVK